MPALVRDGDSHENEFRWSCTRNILPEEDSYSDPGSKEGAVRDEIDTMSDSEHLGGVVSRRIQNVLRTLSRRYLPRGTECF